ncbi:MAG: polyribonucleotide nucleotidyltransferase [Bryobacterales bacterium]|nr:polyribonucleotide nucleotidyltransferase [Bryobacterales bacterium]MDE0623645.1 polyribonucleotide nucleotidyltransferase [Bryobacterales bacterium]
MKHTVEFELDGKTVSLESGRLAKQAGGSVVVRCGDTQVLVAATSAAEPREGIDFFPLTVDYREYTYSAGRFPGGYIKREARPTEKETVTCRLIDRPLRPLFPDGYRNETQIIGMVTSSDPTHDPSVYAMVGASAAVAVSDIPIVHTTGSVRVARLGEDEWVLNPTYEQLADANVNITVAAAKDGIVMVEADATEADEDAMIEAIRRGHEGCKQIIAAIEELAAKAGKPKRDFTSPAFDQAVRDEIEAKWGEQAEAALDTSNKDKLASYAEFRAIKQEIKQAYADDSEKQAEASAFMDPWQEKLFRKQVFDLKRRPDHRAPDQIRPITCEVSELARAHGSAVFTRGETQALVSATLGTKVDGQRQERIEDANYEKTFMVHYNFPPFSVGETGFMRGPGRREIGHGLLAERALTPMIPDQEKFPYTIRVVSDILESNGSSSMATVCGGTLALMDAGVPIKAPVAGIAMGLVTQDDDFVVLTDIAGAEDHYGDMDFKVAGTKDGITALQMDIKQPKVSLEVLKQALAQAREARLEILETMGATLEAPREQLAEHAPQIVQITIPEAKIRDLIGPGGKTIKGLVEETGAKIDVSDDGTVSVASSDRAKGQEAIEKIKALTASPEVGKEYLGRVTKIAAFGAFVEIFPGTEGLLHISEISDQHVREVSDELNEGDQVLVKCLALDGNRIRLSRRAILQERNGGEDGDRPDQSDRSDWGRRRGGRPGGRGRPGRDRGDDRGDRRDRSGRDRPFRGRRASRGPRDGDRQD